MNEQYFLPPFYLVDKTKKLQYNIANNRVESLCNFNSKPFRLLTDKEVSILNKKLLESKL